MNTETISPAYLVQVKDLANPHRYTPHTFREAQPLEARQAAFAHVQRILTQRLAHETLQATIELVELDRSSIGGKQRSIATVFQQYFQRIAFMQDGKDLLANMQMDDFTKRSLPPSLFKSVGLEQTQASNSLEVVEQTLTAEEIAYYGEKGYSISF